LKKCSEKYSNNLKVINYQSNLVKLANTILADRNNHDTDSDKLSNTSTSDIPNEEFIKLSILENK